MSQILKAAKEGNFEEIKHLVQTGADVNARDSNGETVFHSSTKICCKIRGNESVLHYAVQFGSLKIVKYLVEHGADVNSKNKWDKSVLHHAAQYGSLEMVKYSVETGADGICTAPGQKNFSLVLSVVHWKLSNT